MDPTDLPLLIFFPVSLLYSIPELQQAPFENTLATPAKEAGRKTADSHLSLHSSKSISLVSTSALQPPFALPHLSWSHRTFPLNLSLPMYCFIPAPKSSMCFLRTHRPFLPGKRVGRLQIPSPCPFLLQLQSPSIISSFLVDFLLCTFSIP